MFSTIFTFYNYLPGSTSPGLSFPVDAAHSTQLDGYTAYSGTFPDYLVWEDSTEFTKTRVTRITDRTVFGQDGQRVRHNYSLDQTFNSNGTLCKMAGFPAAMLDVDNDFAYIGNYNIPSYGRWSNRNPDTVYGTQNSPPAFVSQNILTNSNARTTLFDFSSDYDSIDFGFGKGNQDENDRYVGLIGQKNGVTTLIVYDIQQSQVIYTKVEPDVRWFTVSVQGNYCVIGKNAEGTGNGTGGTGEGIIAWNLDFTNETSIVTGGTPHGTVAVDQNGDEVYVAYATGSMLSGGDCMFMSRLSDGTITQLYPKVSGKGIWGGHVSYAIGRPGWIYVTEQYSESIGSAGNSDSGQMAQRETFALKLDGTNTVQRFIRHHNEAISYLHNAMGSVNRDGTKVVYASNYGDSGEEAEEAPHSYIVELRQS